MRWPLVVIALIVGLVLWDHYANDSAYIANVERGLRQTAADMPGGA
ncbi:MULTISPECIES: hypothetical protein [unclassified Mesorhizobium]|nr:MULTISPECIES: hypothetical protein [unclassified Mesorhizobium]MCT2580749.1 hypothetical protein [Mesorhizobium sp. P13.3]MDF3169691.1 hypothetical protein [Mesorhizobium sp. P16.1]MDF3179457.1 hypothetical protein [Mesorhizobium sp. P17.1]MDF3186606.1 hypothetical protein [Mesorhizobium sp. ICCV3110.1]MDG4887888.1 hypothetical protein [Mesorhizobium sp. WSM4887]